MRLLLSFILLLSFGTACAQVELRTYYDQNKEYLKEILHVTDSQSQVLVGDYTLFYLDSSLQAKGQYENGLPVGLWEYYYENGNPKMKGELRDNTNYGKWEFYYENGTKSREGELYNGQRQGLWIHYYENGQIKSQGNYVDSRSDGIWNYFYEDQVLKGQAFYEKGTGTYKEFYHSGSLKVEGLNKEGRSDGLWKYYFESGELQSEGFFSDGARSGEWKFYHLSGSISAIGNFANGRKTGPWKYYYEDGTVSSEGVEKNSQKDGYWKLYYDTGELMGEGNFNEGSGDYKEYYPNGRLKISGQLIDGQNEGKWYYYYEDGNLDGEAQFVNGEGEYTGYYPDGKIKTRGQIKNDKKIGEWKLYDEKGQLAGFYKPIYEDVPPVFRTTESIEEQSDNIKYEKPEYRFKNRNIRYFTPTINEYKGTILAINPLFTLIGNLPVSAEYYWQERLGYELQYIHIRDPFYKSNSSVGLNDNFKRGFKVKFRQKFYHRESSRLGMFYFAHELSFTSVNHLANVIDSLNGSNLSRQIEASENRFEYGITIGNRWMKNPGNAGPTIDVFIGLGIGIRDYDRKFEANTDFDDVFDDVNKTKTSVPFIFGINFGIIGPKRETSVR